MHPAFDRETGPVVLDRFATATFRQVGDIHFATMGELPNPDEQVEIDSGQKRASSRTTAQDVACSVRFSDKEAVEKVLKMCRLTRTGSELAVDRAVPIQYWQNNSLPGPVVRVEECFLHSPVMPATTRAAAGTDSKLTFQMSVFNVQKMPGT